MFAETSCYNWPGTERKKKKFNLRICGRSEPTLSLSLSLPLELARRLERDSSCGIQNRTTGSLTRGFSNAARGGEGKGEIGRILRRKRSKNALQLYVKHVGEPITPCRLERWYKVDREMVENIWAKEWTRHTSCLARSLQIQEYFYRFGRPAQGSRQLTVCTPQQSSMRSFSSSLLGRSFKANGKKKCLVCPIRGPQQPRTADLENLERERRNKNTPRFIERVGRSSSFFLGGRQALPFKKPMGLVLRM